MASRGSSEALFVRVPYFVADALPAMSRAALAVYIALARHADWERRTCRASYTSLSKWAGVNRKTIPGAIRELAERGFVSWESGGKGRSNLYRLPIALDPPAGSTHLLGQPSKRAYPDPVTGPNLDPSAGSHDEKECLFKNAGSQGMKNDRIAKLNSFYSQTVSV